MRRLIFVLSSAALVFSCLPAAAQEQPAPQADPNRNHHRQRPRHLRRHRQAGPLCRRAIDPRNAATKQFFRLCEREER